ncbi:tachykinin-like peptides receptor 99D [Saccoglossus kowalevskii]|uniref:Tachykinin-like peptides receptor 99D-like n=1 Tax=Saccoglossus kowalevskii TaxID=10224 RepID=A0ABM0GR25_SACKO|nr:PREDICTED: tachykinin-like peptides receptor 99D-like [Saccoglossus kowalevskii]
MASNSSYIASLNFTLHSTLAPSVESDNEYNWNETCQDFQQPIIETFIWTLLFCAMIVTAAVGNCIVMWIVLAHRRMRTVTNYFIVNLALADALNAIFNISFTFTYVLRNDWYFGNAYCKIVRFISPLTVASSIFTLMAISIDRYIAIVHPMRPRMSKILAKTIIAVVWIASAVIALPWLIFTNIDFSACPPPKITDTPIYVRRVCATIWPDQENYGDWYFWYSFSFMVATYFLPLIAQGVSYSIVGIKLWGSQAPGEISNRHREQLKAKRKVVKMMILVVVIFAICWLPVHIYFLLGRSYSDVLYSHPNAREIYMAVFWLGMSNSMYNPFIYCWLNDRFRRGFRKALRWLPCFKWAPGERVDSQRPTTLSGTYSTSQGMKLMRNGSDMTTTVDELENTL